MEQDFKETCIRLAQEEAEFAIKEGNTPIGSVLVSPSGEVVERAHNTQNSSCDPTAHAEINLLRKAAQKLRTRYLNGYSIFSSAEPCSMCVSAGIKAKIFEYYFGAPHEPSMDPDLSIFDLIPYAKEPITVEGEILKKSCEAQIKRGRESLATNTK